MDSSSVTLVQLILDGAVVGTARHLGSATDPIRSIHGKQLVQFAKQGEDLVAIRDVHIFEEFQEKKYPFEYHCLDGPPERLGDLNDPEKHYKAIIAWDGHLLSDYGSPMPSGKEISAGSANSKSEKRVRFGEVTYEEISQRQEVLAESQETPRVSGPEQTESNPPQSANCLGTSESSDARTERREDEETHARRAGGSSVIFSQGMDRSRHCRDQEQQESCSPSLLSPAQRFMARRMRSGAQRRLLLNVIPEKASYGDRHHYTNRDSAATGPKRNLSTAFGLDPDFNSPKRRRTGLLSDFGNLIGAAYSSPLVETALKPNGLQDEEFDSVVDCIEKSSPSEASAQLGKDLNDFVKEKLSPEAIPLRKRRYIYARRRKGLAPRQSKIVEDRLVESTRQDNPFDKLRECCQSLQCFETVNVNTAFRAYKKYMGLRAESREKYRDALERLFDVKTKAFWFHEQEVCTRFLSRGFKFSNDLQSSVKKTLLAVNTGSLKGIGVAGMPRETHIDTEKDRIVRYLRQAAEDVGNRMPHKSFTNLPDAQKKLVYEQFVKSYEEREMEPPTLQYFYRVWKTDCTDVKTRKHDGFTKCSVCEDLRARLVAERGNEAAVQIIREEKSLHDKVMREERLGYMSRAERAERNPRKYCSLIVDGADQKNYGLPHFSESTKSDRGHKLKVKCVGVLEHLKDNNLTLYTMTEEHESGANHVLEAIHMALGARKQRFGKLSEVLFVQADNCTRENKNRFFMTYFEMLVARGVFIEVQISFLPIGHTHADIDQAFSCVAKRLQVRDATTMSALLRELRECYLPRATATRMTKIANFSGLCVQTGCFEKIKGFSRFRYFRFSRSSQDVDENGYYPTECHVKIQGYENWKCIPASNGEKGFLKFVPNLADTPPSETKPPENITEINKCLQSMEQRVKDTTSMAELRSLRDEVYTKRIYNFHWDLQQAVETNGDYRSNVSETEWSSGKGGTERFGTEFDYNPGSFVAVKTEDSEICKFWVAQVLGTKTKNDDGRPIELEVLWFSAEEGYENEYVAKYKIARTYDTRAKRHVRFKDSLEVASVVAHFDNLTRAGFIRMNIQSCIRQALHSQ